MYDSQLGVNCSFYSASDGTSRCMPWETELLGLFSDSACSLPIAPVTKGCSTPKYAFDQVTTDCQISYVIYQLGSAYTGTVYSGTPSNCSTNTSSSSTYDFYSVTVVPPSTFVQATVQTDS